MRPSACSRIARAWLLVAVWASLVWYLGSDAFGASSTSRYLAPLIEWLWPDSSFAQRYALLIAIRNQYEPANERLKTYLTTIGRRKLVLPLYKALLATPAGRQHAEAIYAAARPGYHPITVESVDRLLGAARSQP